MKQILAHFKDKKHIIWDWNGTLLNDIDVCVGAVNAMLEKHGLSHITKDDYRKKFGFPVHKFYLEIGLTETRISFDEINEHFHGHYEANLATTSVFPGAIELLAELQGQGKHCYILSAAKEVDILKMLETHDMKKFFQLVYGLTHHKADSKVQRGKDLMAKLNIDPKDAILVGDTDHDLEVGKAIGIDVLLLGDGHQCHTRLEKIHPHVVRNRR